MLCESTARGLQLHCCNAHCNLHEYEYIVRVCMCTIHSHVRAARRVIARLSLSRRIETGVCLEGLCGGAAAHELFLADYFNAVCAFDVRTGRLDARDAYTPPNGERVNDVAYSAESDSLFVATWHVDDSGVSVRSLARRTDGQWSECHRMQLAPEGDGGIWLRVLCDGTLLCCQCDTDCIHVCRAHSDRSLQHCARVALPATHIGFDAQLDGNERRLAAALSDGSVALFRVDTEPAALVQLSRVMLAGAQYALFCGDSLLVGVATDSATGGDMREAVSYTTTDGRLQRDRQLIPRDDRLDIYRWCFVKGTLFAWDWKSEELLLFNAA